MMAEEIIEDELSIPVEKDPVVQKYNRRAQIYEVLAVVCLAGSLGVVWLNLSLYWLIPYIALAVLACFLAIRYSYRADCEAGNVIKWTQYEVTPERIMFLRERGGYSDVVVSLEKLINEKPVNETTLIDRLEEDLGEARTGEVKAIVLKYTRVRRKLDT
jgi:hypothetical protein